MVREKLEKRRTELMMEMDCIDNLFECKGIETYEQIAEICKENGFDRVFDIGCAYGHQSIIFSEADIWYFGIGNDNVEFYNRSKCSYEIGKYPFQLIHATNNNRSVAVSVLCLTWNCYLYEGDKTLREQLEALQRDFKHVILYMQADKLSEVEKYFKVKHQSGNLVLLEAKGSAES